MKNTSSSSTLTDNPQLCTIHFWQDSSSTASSTAMLGTDSDHLRKVVRTESPKLLQVKCTFPQRFLPKHATYQDFSTPEISWSQSPRQKFCTMTCFEFIEFCIIVFSNAKLELNLQQNIFHINIHTKPQSIIKSIITNSVFTMQWYLLPLFL